MAGNTERTLVLARKSATITEDVLRAAIEAWQSGRAEKQGQMTLSKLSQKTGAKLENIEVTDKNIGAFQPTAAKYGIDYALKRDRATDPPTWYVFFKCTEGNEKAMTRALDEFATKKDREKAVTRESLDRTAERQRESAKQREKQPPQKGKDELEV